MNVAVFSYFNAGFKYGVGLAYEGGPLFVFGATAFTIYKALADEKEHRSIQTGNNLAIAMLVFTGLWIIHSVSYRLYGYRVDWRLEKRWRLPDADNDQQDPRFHLGAAQGHPTWRTPLGQSTSVIMTALAWSMVRVVKQDLALQQCRPDWVFHTMLFGAPSLISFTIVWNIFHGTRCRKIIDLLGHGDELNPSLKQMWRRFRNLLKDLLRGRSDLPDPSTHYTKFSKYPGYISYKYFMDSNFRHKLPDSICYDNNNERRRFYVLREYVQAAALQDMERNSLSVEIVPSSRLT
uniref:Uncharacterized protein n=1 Tax=Physcomitrium patens TaxID=3218 RepID=A0A2K1LBE4_PHYPA|nr:hypothetical protein PHYPA_001762 [Physcomitrium patens]